MYKIFILLLITNGYLFSAVSPSLTKISITEQPVVINEIMYHPFHHENEPENTQSEFIEITNYGDQSINLSGWQFSNGIKFVFPDINIHAGDYLVIAADAAEFKVNHPTIINIIGNWSGKLSNSGERIKLENSSGETVDEVRYSDEGSWAVRQRGELDYDHRGWEWSDEHDGDGMSLELINPTVSIQSGQNWAASKVDGGTPGKINSVYKENTVPLILNADHSPVIPHSNEQVTISAPIWAIDHADIEVTLCYRIDGQTQFNSVEMTTLSQTGESKLYTAPVPAMPHGTIIEFYIEAMDDQVNSQTYPPPSRIDESFDQVCNLLYQVDDFYNNINSANGDENFKIIMTEVERAELIDIIGAGGYVPDRESDAEMNATFISQDISGIHKVNQVGVRIRGHGTRKRPPISLRVNFPSDNLWKDLKSINLNTKYTHLQVLGAAVFERAGLVTAKAKPVKLLINGNNLALTETMPERMHGQYAYIEVINEDFAANHFPDDKNGNIYKGMRAEDDTEADLRYEGTDPLAYIDRYFKETNQSEFNWTDLIHLTDVLNNTPDESYAEAVSTVIDVDQWLRWFAVEAMLSNNETNLGTGQGDDYCMYRGMIDPRFILLPYDLDTIFGQGDAKVPANGISIWRPTQVAAIDRLITHPQFISQYYWQLKDVIETIFKPDNFDNLIDDVLGEWAQNEPDLSSEITLIKQFVDNRSKYILYGGYPRQTSIPQIPNHQFAVECTLPIKDSNYLSNTAILTASQLKGTADVTTTRSVLIDTVLADWNSRLGKWQVPSNGFTLKAGINHIEISTFDGLNGKGNQLQSDTIDIWNNATSDTMNDGLPSDIPKQFLLHQNYPNPFNQSTQITFELPKDAELSVIVYDQLGREVRSLAEGNFKAGIHNFIWDSQNNKSRHVSTGIYIIHVQTDRNVFTKKMLLMQ